MKIYIYFAGSSAMLTTRAKSLCISVMYSPFRLHTNIIHFTLPEVTYIFSDIQSTAKPYKRKLIILLNEID